MEIDLEFRQKNLIINLCILLLACFIAFKIFQSVQAELASLAAKKVAESSRSATVKSIDGLASKVKNLKRLVNDKDVGAAFSTISSLAKASGVNIASLKPLPEVSTPLYFSYVYQINAACSSFNALGKFVSSLENHRFLFTIENISVSAVPGAGDEVSLVLDMRVSTVILK